MGNNEIKSEIDKSIEETDLFSYLYDNAQYSIFDFNQSQILPESSSDSQAIMDLTGKKSEEQISQNKIKIFEVIYPEKISLFTNIENKSTDTSLNGETSLLKRKRNIKRRRRSENNDNIRKKIKRGFLNKTLIYKLNLILKYNGINSYFVKFPKKVSSNVTKEPNKKLLNMTLFEIFETKELYQADELDNYYHNLNVVEKEDIKEKFELKEILNKKYCELFEEYINSKEFKIDEINRLKKKYDNSYIENYICLAKHFIEFVSN